MILNGAILGALAFAALLLIFIRMPLKVQSFLVRRPLVSEIISIAFLYAGITLVAQSTAAVVATFTGAALWSIFMILKKKEII